jgi:hypothetical protein
MRSTSTIEVQQHEPSTTTIDDPAARDARIWLVRRLRWERHLAELRAEHEHAHT